MIDQPISPLRQRMIDDMTARRFKEKAQKDYVRHVRTFAAFLGRSPDTATSEDVRLFQVAYGEGSQIGAPTINAAVAALRFFFNVTLERPDLVRPLTSVHKPRKAPIVLNQRGGGPAPRSRARPEVQGRVRRRLRRGPARVRGRGPEGLRHRQRAMTLRVEQGKGQRDRYRHALAATARMAAPMVAGGAAAGWLFPGQNPVNPMSARQLGRAVRTCGASGRDPQAGIATYAAA